MPLLYLSLVFVCGILLDELLPATSGLWFGFAGTALVIFVLQRLWLRTAASSRAGVPRPTGWIGAGWLRWIGSAWQWLSRLFASMFPSLGLPILLLLAVLFLGAARMALGRLVIDHGAVAYYTSEELTYILEGQVVDYPDVRDGYTRLLVSVEQLHPTGELRFTLVEGEILATVPPGDWQYGDRVRLSGWLSVPFETETFSYRRYLERQGVGAVFTCRSLHSDTCAIRIGRGGGSAFFRAIYTMRERAAAALVQLLPDPESSLLTGIVLGLESGIPAGVQEAFEITGASHIIAISGYNFAIIAALLAGLFERWFGRWRGMLAALLGMILYAALAGASAGVVRAAVMGGLGVFARQVGRQQQAFNSLAFVAAVMALYDPYVLWDVGFQLSFAATLGLMLYAAPLTAAFEGFAARWVGVDRTARLAPMVGDWLLLTVAAQITTLPLLLYYFQRLSLISLVANPLVLPVQPVVMLAGGAAALLGAITPLLGTPAAWIAWPFLAYTIRVLEFLAYTPLADIPVAPLSIWLLVVFYFTLFGLTAFGSRLKRWLAARFGARFSDAFPSGAWGRLAIPALLGLGAAAIVIWQNVLAAPDGYLHLTVLDVSRTACGDALLVQTPDGARLLIDGGPSPTALSDSLGRRLPLGRRRLDWLVVGAAGDEQLTSLTEVLPRYPPDRVLWAGPTTGSASARRLYRYLGQAGLPVVLAQPGQSLDLGRGAALRVLTVGRRGMVLLLEWGRFRALLPLGPDFDDLQALIDDPSQPPVTALLLAESGYAPLNPPEWMERWRPQVVLLSVAPGDPYGRPAPEVLSALKGYTLLRTDRNGAITLVTDGKQMWVEVENP